MNNQSFTRDPIYVDSMASSGVDIEDLESIDQNSVYQTSEMKSSNLNTIPKIGGMGRITQLKKKKSPFANQDDYPQQNIINRQKTNDFMKQDTAEYNNYDDVDFEDFKDSYLVQKFDPGNDYEEEGNMQQVEKEYSQENNMNIDTIDNQNQRNQSSMQMMVDSGVKPLKHPDNYSNNNSVYGQRQQSETQKPEQYYSSHNIPNKIQPQTMEINHEERRVDENTNEENNKYHEVNHHDQTQQFFDINSMNDQSPNTQNHLQEYQDNDFPPSPNKNSVNENDNPLLQHIDDNSSPLKFVEDRDFPSSYQKNINHEDISYRNSLRDVKPQKEKEQRVIKPVRKIQNVPNFKRNNSKSKIQIGKNRSEQILTQIRNSGNPKKYNNLSGQLISVQRKKQKIEYLQEKIELMTNKLETLNNQISYGSSINNKQSLKSDKQLISEIKVNKAEIDKVSENVAVLQNLKNDQRDKLRYMYQQRVKTNSQKKYLSNEQPPQKADLRQNEILKKEISYLENSHAQQVWKKMNQVRQLTDRQLVQETEILDVRYSNDEELATKDLKRYYENSKKINYELKRNKQGIIAALW